MLKYICFEIKRETPQIYIESICFNSISIWDSVPRSSASKIGQFKEPTEDEEEDEGMIGLGDSGTFGEGATRCLSLTCVPNKAISLAERKMVKWPI